MPIKPTELKGRWFDSFQDLYQLRPTPEDSDLPGQCAIPLIGSFDVTAWLALVTFWISAPATVSPVETRETHPVQAAFRYAPIRPGGLDALRRLIVSHEVV
jgi:hypothetical protein